MGLASFMRLKQSEMIVEKRHLLRPFQRIKK